MVLFKRRVEEAYQFIGEADDPSDLAFYLDKERRTGIYKVDDTQIGIVLDSEDTLNIKKGEIILKDAGAIDGSAISLFISGGALYFKGASSTITRLAVS